MRGSAHGVTLSQTSLVVCPNFESTSPRFLYLSAQSIILMRSLIFLLFIAPLVLAAQPVGAPKLVVGIVVDQMRYEYLYRYERKFGEGGFKRLMKEGFDVKNGHYDYVPTYTGPGHASVYTGTTPSVHGIIGNDWYQKESRDTVNCVGDSRYVPVGSQTGNGDVSPFRMLTTTITDELELSSQRRAKVVGISLKDRSAVLPAGHTPDGAYWFDGTTGKFITSSYYKATLPVWMDQFNAKNLADKYLNQVWNTLLPIEQYKESGPDDTAYENIPRGKTKSTFPYDLKALRKENGEFEFLDETPFGNDIVAEAAKAAIDGEAMGKDEWTDFLAVSFSSTDIVGHGKGPNAVEIEDIYLRLDRNLADLFAKLDTDVGKGQYLVFLTADHAVLDVPQYLKDLRLPADYFNLKSIVTGLSDQLRGHFPGRKVVESVFNNQVFLDPASFGEDPRSAGVEYLVAMELVRSYLQRQTGVAEVYTRQVLQNSDFNEGGIKGLVRRGFHSKRSGDVAFVLEPGWLASTSPRGTSHGSPYTYDTHVPMLFYGAGVKAGSTVKFHSITDIAPTISVLMKVKFPSGCTGQPIAELFEK
jgi:predicted AlkP superfamily pyrophosphatase or phosphodiesterase